MNRTYRTYQGKTSITEVVSKIIESNPGLSTQEIARKLEGSFDYLTVKRALAHLRDNRYEIENRGKGTGHPTQWYLVSHDPFFKLANQLLSELEGMGPGMRRAYLAEQLEAISNGERHEQT